MLKRAISFLLVLCLALTAFAEVRKSMVYHSKNKTVECRVTEANDLVVFGNPDNVKDFEAHIKMEFWGENYISFCEEGIKGEPTLKDDVIELDLGTRKLQWFKDGTSILKWIEILNEKPVSNKWSLKISDADQFNYFYQRPLAELALEIPGSRIEYFEREGKDWIKLIYPEGGPLVFSERPLEIEGSYAVKHKTKRDHIVGRVNYRTGKVLHIPRPKAVDATGKWVWCSIQVKNGIYTRTTPQEFFDTASYPVIINDDFGKTGVGNSASALNADRLGANGPYSPEFDGDATSVSWYFYALTPNVTFGFHNESGGEPTTKVRDTAEGVALTDEWTLLDLDSSAAVSSGTNYFVSVNAEGTVGGRYDDETESYWYEGKSYVGGTLADFSNPSELTSHCFSAFVTYTPTGATGGQVIFINLSSMGYGFSGFGLILVLAIIRKLRR